jgi:hypothetical protein
MKLHTLEGVEVDPRGNLVHEIRLRFFRWNREPAGLASVIAPIKRPL